MITEKKIPDKILKKESKQASEPKQIQIQELSIVNLFLCLL